MNRKSKDKIGFSRQALLHPIPPQIAGPAPEGQKEAPARTPARASQTCPATSASSRVLPVLSSPPWGRRSPRTSSEEARKKPSLPQSPGAEPGSADSAFPVRGLYGNARLALLGPPEDSSLWSNVANPAKLDGPSPCLLDWD